MNKNINSTKLNSKVPGGTIDKKWIQYVENSKVKTYILKDKENLIGY